MCAKGRTASWIGNSLVQFARATLHQRLVLDGDFLMYSDPFPSVKADLMLLPFTDEKKPIPYLASKFQERHGQVSPDGKWGSLRFPGIWPL
jgi:hypothetical protein